MFMQNRIRDSPIPAGNCGTVSSDVHVLDRHGGRRRKKKMKKKQKKMGI
jgi:hypothetical protein